MADRIKVDELPEFDAASYLDSEATIAAYLTDILVANDAAPLAAALDDLARARGISEIANDRLRSGAKRNHLTHDGKARYAGRRAPRHVCEKLAADEQ